MFNQRTQNVHHRFLEKTVLFLVVLLKYFSDDNCKLVSRLFKRYINDGFIPWHSALDLSVLKMFEITYIQV